MKKHPHSHKPVNVDALRKEIQEVLGALETSGAEFDRTANGLIRETNFALRDGDEAVRKVEKELGSTSGELSDRIEKAVADFVGEEEEE